jgi:alpha-galactosidase
VRPSSARFGWSDEALELTIDVDDAGVARISRLGPAGVAAGSLGVGLPLVDVILAGEGRAWSGDRYCESTAGARLCYVDHEECQDGEWRLLRVVLTDPVTALRAEVEYRTMPGQGTVRSWVRLTNGGGRPLTVESVTSLLVGAIPGLSELDLLWVDNDWLAEGRWQRRPLRDAVPDLNRRMHPGANPRGRFGLTGVGTWSSAGHAPVGALVDRRTGAAWAWQIEHNGGWHWQTGEHMRDVPEHGGAAYVALLGPTDAEHHWRVRLAPGESFTTVPAAIAVGVGTDDVLGRLTAHRRAIRRPHDDHRRLPVIFNDYMNTLMGDPTTDRLLPLIEAAAGVGAEYFCVDAGWYAEIGETWWDTVGLWQPSTTRFPGGIGKVLDAIRAAGMVPGLWLEPEVIGVHSPVAERLPEDAVFARDGIRVVEHGRYQMDLRHPAVIAHLDGVVDFLVGELGVGYLKLDYNINAGTGTDIGGGSAGAGLLAHNRAHLAWLDAVLDRHPGLTIENCASGGMRMDYAMLSRLQLQSTSDQQDLLRYPPIAVAAPSLVTPEQAANWAYPQPDRTDDEIAFTLCGALLGRIHLSGHLNRMTDAQRRLVGDAVATYKRIRADIAEAVPFWPLGLPGWMDSWLALGMRAATATYVVAWRRSTGHDAAGTVPARIRLPVPHLRGRAAVASVSYPDSTARADWDAEHGELAVTLPRLPSACLIQLRPK